MSISVAMLRFWICLAGFVAATIGGVVWEGSTIDDILGIIAPACVAIGLLSLAEWNKTIRVPARRLRRGECDACGYALHGVEADRCPECGVRKP